MPAFFIQYIGGITIKDLRINDEIRASQVRLIDEQGNQVGITSLKEAQDMADDRNLDLVLMSPNAKPPVTRIMDYGKFKYDQEKKEKENKKKQKNVQLKETRFSLNIEDNDLQTKANQTKKFLNNGDKVKVSIRFRGRELGRKECKSESSNFSSASFSISPVNKAIFISSFINFNTSDALFSKSVDLSYIISTNLNR